MNKPAVLFLCVHNSARSQMAEAFLKKYAGNRFDVMSAGLEPGNLNPYVINVMKEKGIDISANKTKSVFDLYKENMTFDYIITVCHSEAAERCPVFPGKSIKYHWPFSDPSGFTGEQDVILEKTRRVRDDIETAVINFIRIH